MKGTRPLDNDKIRRVSACFGRNNVGRNGQILMNITASKIIDDTETGKPKLWKMEIGDDPQKLGEYLLSLQKMIQRNPAFVGFTHRLRR